MVKWFVLKHSVETGHVRPQILGQKPSIQHVHTRQAVATHGSGFCFYVFLFRCSKWICNVCSSIHKLYTLIPLSLSR